MRSVRKEGREGRRGREGRGREEKGKEGEERGGKGREGITVTYRAKYHLEGQALSGHLSVQLSVHTSAAHHPAIGIPEAHRKARVTISKHCAPKSTR